MGLMDPTSSPDRVLAMQGRAIPARPTQSLAEQLDGRLCGGGKEIPYLTGRFG